jgi:electron transfer flavoprotein beta subunit
VAEPFVCAAIKPVAAILDVDWLTGEVTTDDRHLVRTPADAAACAVALELAESLGCDAVVVALAGPAARSVLGEAVAEGMSRAVRVVVGEHDDEVSGPSDQLGGDAVATALASLLGDATVVVCGDASGDRGSGTVPSLLAHALGRPQALGVRSVVLDADRVVAVRRLDGGREEQLAIAPPCVVSVEARAGVPRRAALTSLLGAADRVEVAHVLGRAGQRSAPSASIGPYRPAASDLPAPVERDAVRRALEVVGATIQRDPPALLRLAPGAAAAAILEHLERWGMR